MSNPYETIITSEMIEASIRRARLERSRVMWSMIQRLFSRPEHASEADVGHATKAGLRLG